MDEPPKLTLVTSVQRAVHLMEALASYPNGAPAKRLARQTGIHLSTTYHLLRTLIHEGYVKKLGNGLFVLGDSLIVLGAIATLVSAIRDRAEFKGGVR